MNIPPGASAGVIASRLKEAGAIRSPLIFVAVARLMGHSGDMKAGEYLIQPNRGTVQIMDQLVAGDAEAQWVLVPEGLTARQVGALLDGRRLVDDREWRTAVEKRPSGYGLSVPVSRRSVEGYLMPDTYKFPVPVSEREVIRRMLRNWNARILRPNRDLFSRNDLPLDKIVIIASLIEREAKVPADRPLISAVIRNRLKKKMRLQVDATVIYALGKHKTELSFKDLKTKSEYNTYRVAGLPPGPICSPGLQSVLAALQPARTQDLYYVAQPDGSHIFSRTYEEHKAAIARVKAMKADSAKAAAPTAG